jgi:hypothetical protein
MSCLFSAVCGPGVASLDDVRQIALALPETNERPSHGNVSWRVRDKAFVWERPLRPKELRDLGVRAPSGPILGAHVEDLGVKEALLQDDPEVFFTTPHFDGYSAVLVRLEEIPVDELSEVTVEAWLCRAPKRLAREYAEANVNPLPESRSSQSVAGPAWADAITPSPSGAAPSSRPSLPCSR